MLSWVGIRLRGGCCTFGINNSEGRLSKRCGGFGGVEGLERSTINCFMSLEHLALVALVLALIIALRMSCSLDMICCVFGLIDHNIHLNWVRLQNRPDHRHTSDRHSYRHNIAGPCILV